MTTLCFDKTGTLTNNHVKIDSIYHITGESQISKLQEPN